MGEISARSVAGETTVERWLGAHASHWDVAHSDEETRRRLETLAEFCTFAGQTPDELVASLFRSTPEGPRIRLKRRREVAGLIREFEDRTASSDARGARAAGNLVRSFLIHNGVALSAPAIDHRDDG